jgi:ComF family protein
MLIGAIQRLRDGILSLTYPQECRICHQPVESWDDGIVCAPCWSNPRITRLFDGQPACGKCHLPLPPRQNVSPLEPSPTQIEAPESSSRTPSPATATGSDFCGQCASMPFTIARACGAYGGALEANVLFLKSRPYLCPRLRQLLLRAYVAGHPDLSSQLVMPVPLHPSRRQERGFNQAEVVASLIARQFHLPLDTTSLRRTQNTRQHRAGMDAFDRRHSLLGAFRVVASQSLQAASVLLVDDVFTTGSTICAATEALLEAGVARVQIFTLVRVT